MEKLSRRKIIAIVSIVVISLIFLFGLVIEYFSDEETKAVYSPFSSNFDSPLNFVFISAALLVIGLSSWFVVSHFILNSKRKYKVKKK